MKNTKLIPKHQLGKKILKFFESFGNAQIAGESGVGTSMAVASGYQYNPKTRKWEQSEKNLKEAEGLRNNLAFLSAYSPTHPISAVIDKALIPVVGAAYKGVRNNIAARAITKQIDSVSPVINQQIKPKQITINTTPSTPKNNKLWNKLVKKTMKSEKDVFIDKFNDFANKYGYPTITNNISYGEAKYLAKRMLNRHNQFTRGVTSHNNMSFRGLQDEDLLRFIAEHGRDNEAVFTAPRAGYCGSRCIKPDSRGKNFIMRRVYKLGDDPLKWFDEGDFPLSLSDYTNHAPGVHGLGTSARYGEQPTEVLFYQTPVRIVRETPYNREISYKPYENYEHLISKKFIDAPGIQNFEPTPPWNDPRAWKK